MKCHTVYLCMLIYARSFLAEYNRKSRADSLGLPAIKSKRTRSKLFQGFDETKGIIEGGFLELQGPAL